MYLMRMSFLHLAVLILLLATPAPAQRRGKLKGPPPVVLPVTTVSGTVQSVDLSAMQIAVQTLNGVVQVGFTSATVFRQARQFSSVNAIQAGTLIFASGTTPNNIFVANRISIVQ